MLPRLPADPPRRALWLVAVALLVLLLIEGAFRSAGAHRFRHWLDYGYSPTQGLLARPDGRIALYSSAHRRLWPRVIDARPAAGVQRIVVLGDSVARGSSGSSNYAHFAEQSLRALGCRAEVINLSSGGYGSARKAVLADMALARLSPQVLLYQMSVTTEYEDTLDERRRAEAAESTWRIERLSYAALWLKERKSDILHDRRLSPRIREHGQGSGGQAVASKLDVAAWLPRMWANSQRIDAAARQAGVALAVFPRLSIDRATGQAGDMGLGEWAERLVGPQRVFRLGQAPTPAELRAWFADSTHLTPAGAQVVGEQLARWLVDRQLCPITRG